MFRAQAGSTVCQKNSLDTVVYASGEKGLHDIPNQDVSLISSDNTLAAWMLTFDVALCIFFDILTEEPFLYACAMLWLAYHEDKYTM